MPSEKSSYATLKRNLIVLARVRINRVENMLVPGMPDVNICIDGVESWIEIKTPTEPKRPTTPLFRSRNHPLSIEQVNWFKEQVGAGGRCWLYIDTDQRRMLINGPSVVAFGEHINKMMISELIAVSKLVFPKRSAYEDWSEFRKLLREI